MQIEADIGQRLGLARERAGLSQGQIARLLGVSKGAVSQWEQGLNIPQSRLMQMAEYYGVSHAWVRSGKPTSVASEAAADVAAILEKSSIDPTGKARIIELIESLA